MNFRNNAILIGLAFFVTCALSCNKKDKDNDAPRSELIIGTWKMTNCTASPAIDFDNNGTMETNLFPLLSSCEKDDLLKFQTGGVLIQDEGASKCDPSDPQIYTSTWALSNSDNTLSVDGDPADVAQLDQTTLRVSFGYVDGGRNITIAYTYTRQ